MERETRAKYRDYIAEGLRHTMNETGLGWPEDTIIITKPWCDLAKLDDLLGYDVYVTGMESEYDFSLAFIAEKETHYALLKAFNDYLKLYPMES